MLQIEADGALVAVVVEKRGGKAAAPVAAGAGVVAALGRFDLDHVGALVAEDHRRQRPGDIRGQVYDPIAIQRTRHASPTLVRSPVICGTSGENDMRSLRII